MQGRCPSCGGELIERLGAIECTSCGARVLSHTQRDSRSAPWDPPSAPLPVRAPEPVPESGSAPAWHGLESGISHIALGVRDTGNERLIPEKWAFLIAYFLGSIFVTYAFLNSGGTQAVSVPFLSVAIYVSGPTLVAAVVLFWRNGSIKNGCLVVVGLNLIFSAFTIYKAASSHHFTLLYGLVAQTAMNVWLASILVRDSEIE